MDMGKGNSVMRASEIVVLMFEVDKMPQMNCEEQSWADGLLSCLRENKPESLPEGVKIISDFMHGKTLQLGTYCTCHERDGSYVCSHCYSQGHRGHMQG